MLLGCNGAIETELDRRHGRREVRREKRSLKMPPEITECLFAGGMGPKRVGPAELRITGAKNRKKRQSTTRRMESLMQGSK